MIDVDVWERGEFAFHSILVPLIRSSQTIRIFGFNHNWRTILPPDLVPDWLPILESHLIASGSSKKELSITQETALLPELERFWFFRWIHWRESPSDLGKKTFSACTVVLEVSVEGCPISEWMGLRDQPYWNVNVVDNFFAGCDRGAAAWMRKMRGESPNNLYFHLYTLDVMRATGSDDALRRYCERINTELGFPGFTDESLIPLPGESVPQAVARLARGVLRGRYKCP